MPKPSRDPDMRGRSRTRPPRASVPLLKRTDTTIDDPITQPHPRQKEPKAKVSVGDEVTTPKGRYNLRAREQNTDNEVLVREPLRRSARLLESQRYS